MVADIEEFQARRLNAKEVLTPMKGDNFKFPVADGTVRISGGDQDLRTSTLIQERPERGEEQEALRGEELCKFCLTSVELNSCCSGARAVRHIRCLLSLLLPSVLLSDVTVSS